VIRLVFARFRELGSARQVLLSMTADRVHFPRPSDSKELTIFEWRPIRYRSVISVLKNPFYAGLILRLRQKRKADGDHRWPGTQELRPRQIARGVGCSAAGSPRGLHRLGGLRAEPGAAAQLGANAYGQAGGMKSGRGGRAMSAGLLTCGRCGRRLPVVYAERHRGGRSSSTTAGSRLTSTRLSAQSARSRSAARTACLPAPTAVPGTGRSPPR
jgi:hypothetical protein